MHKRLQGGIGHRSILMCIKVLYNSNTSTGLEYSKVTILHQKDTF